MNIEPRMAVVTIYGGDYLDRIRHLERQAEAARMDTAGVTQTLDETPEYLDLARQHDELVKEAEAQALHVRLRALRRSEWRRLVAEHPPRDGNEGDASVGVNEEEFREALVPASIVEPELTLDDLDEMSDADFDRLYLTAFSLNRGTVADPKADLVSRMTRPSDETSS